MKRGHLITRNVKPSELRVGDELRYGTVADVEAGWQITCVDNDPGLTEVIVRCGPDMLFPVTGTVTTAVFLAEALRVVGISLAVSNVNTAQIERVIGEALEFRGPWTGELHMALVALVRQTLEERDS